jgi:hypothetical protein
MALATEKQIAFLLKLVAERAPGSDMAKAEYWARNATRTAVGNQIDRLLKIKVLKPTEPKVPSVVEAGFYLLDGDVVKVKESKAGRFYAEALVVNTRRFEYAPGLVHKLSPEDKLTAEKAAEFGHTHGYCCFCQRELTDAKSVAKGYGPVCERKYL